MTSWVPKERRIEADIAEEEARLQAKRLRAKQITPLPEFIPEAPFIPEEPPPFLLEEPQPFQWIPSQRTVPIKTAPEPFELPEIRPELALPAPILPQAPPVAPTLKEKLIVAPFWQRALQIFATPFVWIDENIIKPSLSLAGTTIEAVPEVVRLPGEDFWEWKKRSWASWEAPGINVNVPWSDEPKRLDIKGIMEFAPWLLIPGAGQVGGGVRAARGIAGIVGKWGMAGRVLGTAVEYSPWGLVEKTAGVAIKGGIRAVGEISEKVSTAVGEKLFGKYIPPPVPEAVKEFTNYIKEVVIPARKAFRKELPALRARQLAKLEEVQARYRRGEITLSELQREQALATTGAIRPEFAITPEALAVRQGKTIAEVEARITSGELTEAGGKALITKLRKSPAFTAISLEASKIKELNDMIISAAESGFVKRNSSDAFLNLITGTLDNLPEPAILRDWAKIFGVDFAKAVGQLKTPQAANQLVDALNLPRSVLASADLSATFRQGLILGLLHPTKVPVWFGRQIKAFLSEKLSYDMDDALRARPLFKEFVANGGYFAPLREAIPTKAEELFMSNLARRIPLVRRSERAFITYLNEARMTAYEAARGAMTAQGATAAEFKVLTDFINMASGRGIIPKSLEKYSPALNTMLFSPRLQMATLQLPRQIGRMLLSDNPYMRKEAAKALVTFVGGGSAILGLLKATGNKVELDPRSGDFGKIIIGETRLDIWRGYVQYARFAAQMLTGERKSAYGNMNKAERSEIASRFLQSKSSPAFGLMVDLLRGENYFGKPIFNDTTGFIGIVKERVLPLALQDIIDALEQGGVNKAWIATPAFLGIGSLTFVNDFVRIKEKIAREMGYETWDEIDPKTQREIENRNAELQAATIAFDRQVMGTAWGDWRLAGKTIENLFKQNVELATDKYRQTGDGVEFREKVSDAWIARRGAYRAREAEVRFEDIVKRMKVQDTLESLVSLGPEGLAIRTYNEALYGEDMYDEFGDYRFDEADKRKKLLRQQLGNEMFEYVEQYQAVRYEDFPVEFRELQKAKDILKPLWAVEDTVKQLFGETFAESSRGQALIQKHRKYMRLTNPEIAKYYSLFYQRA